MNCYELGVKCAVSLGGIPVYNVNTLTRANVDKIMDHLGVSQHLAEYDGLPSGPPTFDQNYAVRYRDRLNSIADRTYPELHRFQGTALTPRVGTGGKPVILSVPNRETLAHEAWHAKNPLGLGDSETLARLYGGWRRPRNAGIIDRASSAMNSLNQYSALVARDPSKYPDSWMNRSWLRALLRTGASGRQLGTPANTLQKLTGLSSSLGGWATTAATEAVTPVSSALGAFSGAPAGQRLQAAKDAWTDAAGKTITGETARHVAGERFPLEPGLERPNTAVNRLSTGTLH